MNNPVRVVSKSLATMQDLAKGYGTVIQQRQGQMYELDKINAIWVKETIQDVVEADYTELPIIAVFTDEDLSAYVYDAESEAEPDGFDVLLPESENGRWIRYSMTVSGSAGSLDFGVEQNQLPRNQDLGRRLEINVGGTATTILTDAQAQAETLIFTGTVTQDADIVVPNRPKVWYARNQTTGAFDRRLRTPDGTAIIMPRSESLVIRCNGNNGIEIFDYYQAPLTSSGLTENSMTAEGHTHKIEGSATLEGDDDELITVAAAQPLKNITNLILSSTSEREFDSSGIWQECIWVDDWKLLVAVGYKDEASFEPFIYSEDGTNWNSASITNEIDKSWQSLAYSPKLELAVAVASGAADDENAIAVSTNGTSWEILEVPIDAHWLSVIWVPELELFIASSKEDSQPFMTSTDGYAWTIRSAPFEGSRLDSLAWSPELGLLVATVSGGSFQVMTSPDGITWTNRSAGSASLRSIAWSSPLGLFVAAPLLDSEPFMVSEDGIFWSSVDSPNPDLTWRKMIWIDELSVFVTMDTATSNAKLAYSFNGEDWQIVFRGALDALAWQCNPVWHPLFSRLVILGSNSSGGDAFLATSL